MMIKEAKLYSFGKLQNCTCRFAPGMNVIYGENEAGKTTLHDFLVAMLFGMEKNRGRAAAKDPYVKYEPWHTPSYYSGSLRFSVEGRQFYLERNFYHKEQTAILRNEEDHEELSVAYGDLSMLLGGIGKDAFGNTYDIQQSGAATGKELAGILAEYLSDAAESGDGETHVAKAAAALMAKRKELNARLKKSKERKQQEVNELQIERKLLEQDCKNLRNEIMEAEDALMELKRPWAVSDRNGAVSRMKTEDGPKESEGKHRRTKFFYGMTGAAVLGLVLHFFLYRTVSYERSVFAVGQTALVLLALAGLVSAVLAKRGERLSKEVERPLDLPDLYHSYGDAAAAQADKLLGGLRDSLREKETRLYNVTEYIEEAVLPGALETELLEQIKALELAASEIRRLAQGLCEELEDELNARVSGWVSRITAGKYDSVRVDLEGRLCVMTEGREVPPDALSRGTLEQIYLALRLSVGSIVTKEEAMPIFLDEAFAMYDDRRMEDTFMALTEEKKQIFIFTCQRREMDVLEKLGITYHRVNFE